MATVIRLGRDHQTLGAYQVDAVGDRAAVGISAGAVSRVHKNDPNEDALFVSDDGKYVWFGVADAHWGAAASALLIEWMAHRLPAIAEEMADDSEAEAEALFLNAAIMLLSMELDTQRPDVGGSETTLLLCGFDSRTGKGRGLSWGDSSLVVLGPEHPAQHVVEKNRDYVAPERTRTLKGARGFSFESVHGGLLVAFTDGVDECHYGRPETSIQLTHLDALFEQTGPDPKAFAEGLMQLALAGVNGNPGGEDNIAIVAVRT